jgi:hypothetical protein
MGRHCGRDSPDWTQHRWRKTYYVAGERAVAREPGDPS